MIVFKEIALSRKKINKGKMIYLVISLFNKTFAILCVNNILAFRIFQIQITQQTTSVVITQQ